MNLLFYNINCISSFRSVHTRVNAPMDLEEMVLTVRTLTNVKIKLTDATLMQTVEIPLDHMLASATQE